MQLIDSLRQLGAKLPPSHVPTLNELAGIVGAVIAHAEHGDTILHAATVGAEEVARVLAPVAADVIDAAVPGAAPLVAVAEHAAESLMLTAAPAPAAPAPADEAATIAQLRKELEAAQTQIGQLQATRVTVTPADGSAA